MRRPDLLPSSPGELLRGVLSQPRELAQPLWLARHRAMLALLVAHLVLLPFWGVLNDEPVLHVLATEALLAVLAGLGALVGSRTLAASLVSLGLVAAAASVVHNGGGRSILHFHFFLIVAALALYRQWAPYLLALAFVLVDHAVMGTLAPSEVYDDAFSLGHPWLAAAVHGGYVLGVAAAASLAWTWAERERRSAQERAEQEAARVRDSERRLSGLLDHAPNAIFVKDLQGRFVEANRQMNDVLGLPVLGRTSSEMFGAQAAEVADAHDVRVIATRSPSEVLEYNLVGGDLRVLSVLKFPLLDDTGAVTGVAGIATDITERAAVEQALRRSEERLRGVFARGPVAQMVLHADGTLAEVNPAFCELFGHGEAELVGTPLATLVVPEERAAVGGLLALTAETQRREMRMRTREGEVLSCRVGVAAVEGARGAHYCVGMVEDVTAARRGAAELAHRASHDLLTGLPNRAYLLTCIGEALAEPDRSVAVVFLDLDGFKEVNDSLGHDAGDQLLHTVAQRLDAVRRPMDTLARLGGDEFVLCCPGCEDEEQASAVAERMLDALRPPMSVADRPVEVGGSIGIALGRSRDGASAMLLLRDADTALYAAKNGGRDRAAVFVPAMRERDERRRRLQADLADALRAGGAGLVLEYQPVQDAATGRVVTCEALIRWQHPVDGRLMPEAFLPLAAGKGLSPLLDRWVLEHACAAAAGWSTDAGPVSVAVNISPTTIAQAQIVDWVRDACARSGLEPGRLVVELTETAVVERPQETSRTLARLRATGVRVALDDFGTGYSSLSHLRDLPVDVVKIDRSFTAGAVSSPRDGAIVQATADLAGALGAVVVAEGVETAQHRDAVVAAGCRQLQGWYVSHPLGADAVSALLARQLPRPPAPDVRLRAVGLSS